MEKVNINFNYLNEKYYEKLSKLIKNIRKYTCPNCGGTYNNATCIYCNAINNEIQEKITIINVILNDITNDIEILKINDIQVNTLFNLLHSIPFNIESINSFLKKYHYQETYDNFIKEVLPKINNNENITALEIDSIESLIFQNKNINLNFVYHYFINKCARKEKMISYDCFEYLIIKLTENSLKTFYKKPECIITNQEQEHKGLIISGKSHNHKIWINAKEVEEMYENGDWNLINTIFHELTHGIQFKTIFNGNQLPDPLVLLEIKDNILSNNIPNYYKENYNTISFETEAQYYGLLLAPQYLNLNIKNYPNLLDKLQLLQEKLLNQNRTLNGSKKNIDNIFNEYIYNHPEIFDKHPQLSILYKKENDKIIPYTKEELYLKYEKIINSSIPSEEKEKYELLFSQYIDTQKENPIKSI